MFDMHRNITGRKKEIIANNSNKVNSISVNDNSS